MHYNYHKYNHNIHGVLGSSIALALPLVVHPGKAGGSDRQVSHPVNNVELIENVWTHAACVKDLKDIQEEECAWQSERQMVNSSLLTQI